MIPNIKEALEIAQRELLSRRVPAGHWEGHLSSSALSTATAVVAATLMQGEKKRIEAGLSWLATHANDDGGWGDTVKSFSNLSTTLLCWAALGAGNERSPAIHRAEAWLRGKIGTLEPSAISAALLERYGKDRTFSIPILTMCALAGRLGPSPNCWHYVQALPFELAALPHEFFAAVRLPVVSYALPALIAMGQARFINGSPPNPLLRGIRKATFGRCSRVLGEIQPSNGGFLEATPLTSFVVMSLAGSGRGDHPVARKGWQFLQQSQREDGSWPIDTNLATWLTTLSIEALPAEVFNQMEKDSVRSWLLRQQHVVEHPYTHAAPGGWAWTDLPGGVPDADDTAGALLALRKLGAISSETREAAQAAAKWLVNLQNSDGGMPTFCRGWGHLPFDRSCTDITAHALRAWNAWASECSGQLKQRIAEGRERAFRFLIESQKADGSWIPLWFGNQHHPNEENPTYGTSKVLIALARLPQLPQAVMEAINRAASWVIQTQNPDGSWGGFASSPASVEESALALEALCSMSAQDGQLPAGLEAALSRGGKYLAEAVLSGAWRTPAPIGFYFAKLWYYEELYPLIFSVSALKNFCSRERPG